MIASPLGDLLKVSARGAHARGAYALGGFGFGWGSVWESQVRKGILLVQPIWETVGLGHVMASCSRLTSCRGIFEEAVDTRGVAVQIGLVVLD